MKRNLLVIGVATALSMLVGGTTAWIVSKNRGAEQSAPAVIYDTTQRGGNHFASYQKESYPDLTYAAENAVQAVVNIEVIQEVQGGYSSGGSMDLFEFFGFPGYGYESPRQREPRQIRGGGSGVIISPDGYIVTNNHVVEDATELRVKLYDQRTFEAEVIGTDPTTDVALIKIDAEDLPTLRFGSSDALRLGEWVLAIGSPLELQSTITAGIVSAKARNLGAIPNEYSIESFIQTDAAVNPGNSGGALVNTAGELVGINTLIQSQTGTYIGYSFAVPSSIVQKVITDLREYGVVQRAVLGIEYRNNDNGEGVVVAVVREGSAAEEAGIEPDDLITHINGQKLDQNNTLTEIIGKLRPNDKVKITVKRGEQTKQFEAVLRNKAGKAELIASDYVDAAEALGGTFSEVNERTHKQLGIDGGLRVTSIEQGGVLAQARIRQGYIITHINEQEVRSVRDLDKIGEEIYAIEGLYPDGRRVTYSLVQPR